MLVPNGAANVKDLMGIGFTQFGGRRFLGSLTWADRLSFRESRNESASCHRQEAGGAPVAHSRQRPLRKRSSNREGLVAGVAAGGAEAGVLDQVPHPPLRGLHQALDHRKLCLVLISKSLFCNGLSGISNLTW